MFEHLNSLEIVGKTIPVKLPEVGPRARLICRFAGQSNAHYFNAKLKLAAARPSVKKPTEILAVARDDDRQLYPKFVICGFENVPDKDGQPVVYSVENARDLVDHLPDWLFDRIRDECSEPEKFVPQDEPKSDPSPDLLPS